MPKSIELPEQLRGEVNIAGRQVPLWALAAGAGIAIVLVVIAKLRGGGQQAQSPGASETPGATSGPETGDAFMSALNQVTGQLGGLQEALTGGLGEAAAGRAALGGQITSGLAEAAAARAGLAQQFGAQVGALGQQVGGFQTALEQQSAALTTGLSGVTQQMQSYQADVNGRLAAVEQGLTNLQSTVQSNRQDFSPTQKIKLAQALYWGVSVFNPALQQLGMPTWESRINAQTGGFSVKPSTPNSYWQEVW